MIPGLLARRAGLAAACSRYHVQRLDVVGSAARATDYDPARSDADFLVAFAAAHSPPALADFLALRDALAEALQRPVNLIMATAVRNPFIRAAMQHGRETVYAA